MEASSNSWVVLYTKAVASVTRLLDSNELVVDSISTPVGNGLKAVVDCPNVEVTDNDMLLVVSGVTVDVLDCRIADDRVVRMVVATAVVVDVVELLLLMLKLLNGGWFGFGGTNGYCGQGLGN